ncbi:hypothetical protein PsorP6_004571 [Peronosclerospora sorghi]|uniref:Uncharacterized protein n=1 Tax=Peronosclerospora sorghi TaxID=230839 RepID=A0ACC0VIF3_9STRA|nr:hypothetical protein PsorP6_004571 [Peronosclerospora sorghi]
MNAEEELETELWHARLGHVAISRLESIVKVCDGVPKKLVASVNDMKLCNGCIKGKMSVDKFPSNVRGHVKTTSVLQIVHTDVMGPMSVNSQGKARYALTFIDDYSHFVILSNTDLNLLPVATVNTVQQPIREQLPVERRPPLPPPTEQQHLGYERELSDAIVFRPSVKGRLVVRNHVQSTQVDGSEGRQLVVRQRYDDWTNEPEPKRSRLQLTEKAHLLEEVPNSYREALSSDKKNEWEEAINREFYSLALHSFLFPI